MRARARPSRLSLGTLFAKPQHASALVQPLRITATAPVAGDGRAEIGEPTGDGLPPGVDSVRGSWAGRGVGRGAGADVRPAPRRRRLRPVATHQAPKLAREIIDDASRCLRRKYGQPGPFELCVNDGCAIH